MKLFSKLSLCLGLILAIAPWIHAQDIPWEDVDKTGSDLADLATRDASNVTNTPAGNIAATDAQAAINELDSEKATTAQGALADSATQPGDNVSTLTNDSGYLTTALAAQQFAARAMQGYGISDGATNNRREILTPGAIGAVAGLPLTVLAVIDVPTSLSADTTIWAFQSGVTAPSSASTGLGLRVVASGQIELFQWTGFTAQIRRYTDASFRSDYSGQRIRLACIWDSPDTTDAPRFEINGASAFGGLSVTNAGSPVPNWLPSTSFSSTYFLSGYNWPAGRSPYVRAIIGALSTAESATWGTTGELPTWATRAGSASLLNGTAAQNGSNPYSSFSGASATDVTFSDSSGSARRLSFKLETAGLVVGNFYKITFDWTLNSGTASIALQRRLTEDGGVQEVITANLNDTGAKEFTFVWDGDGEFLTLNKASNGDNSVDAEIENLKVFSVGLIDDPYTQPALATGDRLGRMSRRLLGVAPVPALGTSQVVISHTLTWDGSNHTAQSLTGGQAFEAGFVPTMISLVPNAASSGDGWTIGTSADADRYKTLATYSTGKTIYFPTDFASRIPGGTGATNLDLLIDPDTADYTGSIKVTIYGSNTAGSP